MSKTKANIDGLSDVIAKMLTSYSSEIRGDVDKAAKKVSKDAVKRLKAGGTYKGGKASGYNSGWKVKVTEGIAGVEVVVHNAKAPGLTHLLEKGHAMPQGGRSRAFPHIAPAEQEAVEQFRREVERVIKDA